MSEFVEVKTEDLKGDALDWATAMAVNGNPAFFAAFGARMLGRSITKEIKLGEILPSVDWRQGGPLIDAFGIEFKWVTDATIEAYSYELSENRACGNTHLEAACRLISMELGCEVKVPSELMR